MQSIPPTAPDDEFPRLRGRLLARIRRRYKTVTRRVRMGALAVEFTRIEDPDAVLDQVVEESDRREKISGRRESDEELHLPYWAELWDSAPGIGQHLAAHGAGKDVLDLGCGMGLSGTAAAALGAKVLFADLERPALLFAALNSLPWRGRARTRRVNWQRDHLAETFDTILGADILYEKTQWEFLEPFWRKHLAPGGRVILGEPGRMSGDLFLDWIKGKGWLLERSEETVETRPTPVRVLKLTRE